MSTLYSCSRCSQQWSDLLDCVDAIVTLEMNDVLRRAVEESEIKVAVSQLGNLKAPGPNGFQGVFYQNFWEIISPKVFGMAAECLNGEVSPNLINSMNIILIPEVPHLESMNQLRPINLCNYSFKVLSKILAYRLKTFLPELIPPSQNAFIQGRQINDNIILAHEVFHFLKLRKAKHMFELGIKLAMNKAYDRVE